MATPLTGGSLALQGALALSGAAAVAITRFCYQIYSGRSGERSNFCSQLPPTPEVEQFVPQDVSTITEDAATFACSVMSQAGLLALAIDQRGIVVDWNDRAEHISGFKAESAIGTRIEQLVHEDSRQALAAALNKTARGHNEERIQLRFRDVPRIEVLACASPLRNAAGRVAGMLVTGLDVTLLAERLDTAERVAEDLTRLLETMNVPIIGVDREGSVTEWNRQAESLTGYSKAEVLGRSLLGTMMVEESSRASFTKEVLEDGLAGVEATNYRFPIFTKAGQRREVLLSATTRRSGAGEAVGVLSVGQDITETRAESKMLASYVKICGAAVWFMWGCTKTGAATAWKTKDAEQLIAQESEMPSGDPRMVIWRVYFISILKTMAQSLWWRYKLGQEDTAHLSFEYEFCFEAANGHVKWYKVEGHLIKESLGEREFEVTGSMRECTSMWIEKVMGDKYQKWWSCMCHMVFDATLLVDTQEYRVLNAWGEEKVFGCKLQPNCAVLQLLKADDHAVLKQCFNEVTYKGSERGRTMTLLQPDDKQKEIVAECFLLSADQENPNECMMGIRMDEPSSDGDVAALWNVTKPTRVLTLEDLARLKSGLKQHRRPVQAMRRGSADSRKRGAKRGGHASSLSLTSIPEDMAEGLRDGNDDDLPSVSSVAVGEEQEDPLESGQSSSALSTSLISECGNCNSDPRSVSEVLFQGGDNPGRLLSQPDASPRLSWQSATRTRLENLQQSLQGEQASGGGEGAGFSGSGFTRPKAGQKDQPRGPPEVKIKWNGKAYDVNLDELESLDHLRRRIEELTGIPPFRQTLIHAGRRLPQSDEGNAEAASTEWKELRMSVRPKQPIMLIGSPAKDASATVTSQREPPAGKSSVLKHSSKPAGSHGTPRRSEAGRSPILSPKDTLARNTSVSPGHDDGQEQAANFEGAPEGSTETSHGSVEQQVLQNRSVKEADRFCLKASQQTLSTAPDAPGTSSTMGNERAEEHLNEAANNGCRRREQSSDVEDSCQSTSLPARNLKFGSELEDSVQEQSKEQEEGEASDETKQLEESAPPSTESSPCRANAQSADPRDQDSPADPKEEEKKEEEEDKEEIVQSLQ